MILSETKYEKIRGSCRISFLDIRIFFFLKTVGAIFLNFGYIEKCNVYFPYTKLEKNSRKNIKITAI